MVDLTRSYTVSELRYETVEIIIYQLFSLFVGSFKFCDFDADGWISKDDLLESIELVHQLMGNMFQITINSDITSESTATNVSDTTGTSSLNTCTTADTFTPQSRTSHLFALMDEDGDGKADFNDFKRTVLNDASIIQGFLVYDGVV